MSKLTINSVTKYFGANTVLCLKNDYDNGANFFLTLFPGSYKTSQKEWILPLHPSSLSKFKNDTKITGNFKTLTNDLDENDNPVIMVIKLK